MLALLSFKTFGGEILHRCLIFGKKTCKKVSVGLDVMNPAVALKERAGQVRWGKSNSGPRPKSTH